MKVTEYESVGCKASFIEETSHICRLYHTQSLVYPNFKPSTLPFFLSDLSISTLLYQNLFKTLFFCFYCFFQTFPSNPFFPQPYFELFESFPLPPFLPVPVSKPILPL